MSLVTLNTAPSGSFTPSLNISTTRTIPDVTIFNPGVIENRRNSFQTVADEQRINQWLQSCTGEKKWQFSAAHIDAYADVAVQLAANLSVSQAHCRLGPLRGAARPCLLVEVMSRGAVAFEFFNFRQGSSGSRDSEISRELVEILLRWNPNQDLFRIQVVDTAIGGQGINKLASLLRDIHDQKQEFQRQSWLLDIHLLHPTNGRENIQNILAVQSLRRDRFEVVLTRYPVPDLVAEDYDDANGFELVHEGSSYITKPSFVPGRFLLRTSNEVHLIESEDLSRTFDEFLCEAVTNTLVTDPNRELTAIVWQEYQTKA